MRLRCLCSRTFPLTAVFSSTDCSGERQVPWPTVLGALADSPSPRGAYCLLSGHIVDATLQHDIGLVRSVVRGYTPRDLSRILEPCQVRADKLMEKWLTLTDEVGRPEYTLDTFRAAVHSISTADVADTFVATMLLNMPRLMSAAPRAENFGALSEKTKDLFTVTPFFVLLMDWGLAATPVGEILMESNRQRTADTGSPQIRRADALASVSLSNGQKVDVCTYEDSYRKDSSPSELHEHSNEDYQKSVRGAASSVYIAACYIPDFVSTALQLGGVCGATGMDAGVRLAGRLCCYNDEPGTYETQLLFDHPVSVTGDLPARVSGGLKIVRDLLVLGLFVKLQADRVKAAVLQSPNTRGPRMEPSPQQGKRGSRGPSTKSDNPTRRSGGSGQGGGGAGGTEAGGGVDTLGSVLAHTSVSSRACIGHVLPPLPPLPPVPSTVQTLDAALWAAGGYQRCPTVGVSTGAFGRVWMATSGAADQPERVAVKLQRRRSHLRELHALLRLASADGVVHIMGACECVGGCVLLLPWLEPFDYKRVKADPLQVRRFANNAAHALVAAHRRGISHGDVKPSAFMRSPAGSVDDLVLTDFNLADAAGRTLLKDERLTGTPDWIFVETAPATKASHGDHFSLAIVVGWLMRLPGFGDSTVRYEDAVRQVRAQLQSHSQDSTPYAILRGILNVLALVHDLEHVFRDTAGTSLTIRYWCS